MVVAVELQLQKMHFVEYLRLYKEHGAKVLLNAFLNSFDQEY